MEIAILCNDIRAPLVGALAFSGPSILSHPPSAGIFSPVARARRAAKQERPTISTKNFIKCLTITLPLDKVLFIATEPSRALRMEHSMKPFLIKVRTATTCITFSALAISSTAAAVLTAEVLGDQIYGITVVAGVR